MRALWHVLCPMGSVLLITSSVSCLPQSPTHNTSVGLGTNESSNQTTLGRSFALQCYDDPEPFDEYPIDYQDCRQAVLEFYIKYRNRSWYLNPDTLFTPRLPFAPFKVVFGTCVLSIRTDYLQANPRMYTEETYEQASRLARGCTDRGAGRPYKYGGASIAHISGRNNDPCMLWIEVMGLERYVSRHGELKDGEPSPAAGTVEMVD